MVIKLGRMEVYVLTLTYVKKHFFGPALTANISMFIPYGSMNTLDLPAEIGI